jgi:hypothetical protein
MRRRYFAYYYDWSRRKILLEGLPRGFRVGVRWSVVKEQHSTRHVEDYMYSNCVI